MPSSRGFPDPGIEPASPASPVLQEDSLLLSHWGSPILPIGLWLFITIVASIPITSKNDAIVVQSLSHVWLFGTLWTAACQASLSLTISWSLPKFTSIALMMAYSPLIFWCPLLFLPSIFPSYRDFSSESAIRIRCPKYRRLSISPSDEHFFQWVCWGGLSFPPPVDCILSEVCAMTCLSWVTLHGMTRSFIELCKYLCHDKTVIHEGRKWCYWLNLVSIKWHR